MEQLIEASKLVVAHPLFALLLTLLCYQGAVFLYEKAGRLPLLHPLLVATAMLVFLLDFLGIHYAQYYKNVEILPLFLGVVTVALAIPLYESLRHMRLLLLPVLVTVLLSAPFAVGLVLLLADVFNLDAVLTKSLATKSVTTPIAVLVSEEIGGKAALATAFVLVTGMFAPILVPVFLKLWPAKRDAITGIALGLSSHAIGTAKALEISRECGAFSALTMSLTGILTALFLPWFF